MHSKAEILLPHWMENLIGAIIAYVVYEVSTVGQFVQ